MEPYITLSFLNDFIFCPRSIYFHQLYGSFDQALYKQTPQYKGEAAHTSIEEKTYSTQKNVLQGIEIYSEKYNLCGKIDVFDIKTGKLTERKRDVKTIYDGYVFQVYAQCHALREMGYEVKEIVIAVAFAAVVNFVKILCQLLFPAIVALVVLSEILFTCQLP